MSGGGSMSMEIEEQTQGAVCVLRPKGPVTGAEAGTFKARTLAAMERSRGRVLVDAASLAFVDSLGLEALVDVTEQLGQGGRALKLCCVNATLREVLELTGWSGAFEYFEDVHHGLRSFL